MIIEPLYQLFPKKLKKIQFKDMKTLFPTMDKFKQKVNPDMEKNNLLCPIVLDKDGTTIRSGTHRYEFFKDKYTETLCYVGDNGEETKFFQHLNVFCWRNHPVQKTDILVDLITRGVK
jgi:hypothetical protein